MSLYITHDHTFVVLIDIFKVKIKDLLHYRSRGSNCSNRILNVYKL